MNSRLVFALDAILIAGTLVSLLAILGFARPLLIAPTDELVTTESEVLFKFEKGSLIYIDDNPEFSSPRELSAERDLEINLKPGVYYWKVRGAFFSEVRKLTIESEINLRLRESEDGENYEVINAGNIELGVDVADDDEFVGRLILEEGGSVKSDGDKFVGGENA